LDHVALTVRDLTISGAWYRALLDTEPDIDAHSDDGFHHQVWLFEGGTAFGLHQHDHPGDPTRFSELRTGLDHLAFGCADRGELEQWAEHLDTVGVDHGAIVDTEYGSVLSFRDPDGIALEFFAPPGGSATYLPVPMVHQEDGDAPHGTVESTGVRRSTGRSGDGDSGSSGGRRR
jgi:catechol-2,3-dioxygenase